MPKEIKIKIPAIKDIRLYLFVYAKNLFARILEISKKNFEVFFNDLKTKKWRGILVLSLSLGAIYFWSLSAATFWLFFLAFLFYGWKSRIVAFLVLLFLASCPFLLIFKKDALAEQMAVYAYFFLVMTVVLQIIEYRRDLKNGNITNEE